MTFTGMDISLYTEGEQLMYSMGQGRDMSDFLHAKGLGEEKLRENPMADKRVLTDSEEISGNLQSWCRSVIGGLHYYARGTRYDISYAVSRVSQTLGHPTRGTVRALEHVADSHQILNEKQHQILNEKEQNLNRKSSDLKCEHIKS